MGMLKHAKIKLWEEYITQKEGKIYVLNENNINKSSLLSVLISATINLV